MKRLLIVLGTGLFLVFLYFTALPGDLAVGRDDPTGIAGTYTVNGVDHTGAEYSGTATIIGADNGDYLIEWIITGAIQEGVGVLDGKRFSVEWTATASANGGSGRTVYTVEDDGRMVGQRTVDGVDEVGVEELFPEA